MPFDEGPYSRNPTCLQLIVCGLCRRKDPPQQLAKRGAVAGPRAARISQGRILLPLAFFRCSCAFRFLQSLTLLVVLSEGRLKGAGGSCSAGLGLFLLPFGQPWGSWPASFWLSASIARQNQCCQHTPAFRRRWKWPAGKVSCSVAPLHSLISANLFIAMVSSEAPQGINVSSLANFVVQSQMVQMQVQKSERKCWRS